MPANVVSRRLFRKRSLQRFVQCRPPGLAAGLLAGVLVMAAGCEVTLSPNDNTNGNDNSGPEQPVPEASIVLRLANLTDVAVETEIYLSTNGLDVDSNSLFVPEHRVTEGVGLAATGVLAPDSTDVVDLACGEGVVVGTAGGLFRDVETGEVLGRGTPRILQEGLVFDCGATITLVYREEDGTFSVNVALE